MEQVVNQGDERLRSIHARFVAALPKFVSDTDQRWQELRQQAWSPQHAMDLQVFAHRLAGLGAAFGFPEISRLARALDSGLGELVAMGRAPEPEKILQQDIQVHDLLRAMAQGQKEVSLAATVQNELAEKESKSGKLVVVIDDDELLRARLLVLLEAAGYQVMAAADPDAAMPLLQQSTPDLVLLDLMFPGRGRPAYDVVKTIRDCTGRRTPVAIISGRSDFSSRLEAVRAGADTYLAKPLDLSLLMKTVAQLASNELEGLRCLIVDDDTMLAEQLVGWLREDGIITDSVRDPQMSWQKIHDFQPDVVVMDVTMPDCNGVELATLLRQDEHMSLLPIIFLAANDHNRAQEHAIAAGADDFLTKPVQRETLLDSLRTRARLGQHIHETARRSRQQAPLSRGLSRHLFYAELEMAIDQASDGMERKVLVLATLSEAPQVLKEHGAAGLANVHEQWVARVAKLQLPTWSVLGENTMALLLPDDTAAAQSARIKKITSNLSAQPYRVKTSEVLATMGVAVLHLGRSQATLNAILLQAEQLLGMALAAGPGAIKEGFAGANCGTEVADSGGELPVDKLHAAYQPVVTIDGIGNPVNVVLARIADIKGNLLPPGSFLPMFEKRGWLPELDAWAFHHAHKVLTEQIAADTPLFLVVCASCQSLSSAFYLEMVRSVLAVQPMRNANQCIIIAITECAGITHRSSVEKLGRIVQEAGGGMMITNFGSTSSSVLVLEHLRPLFVRLDEPITQRLEQAQVVTASDKALLEAALSANASVIASGIENARSLSALWAKGVRRFQGYFIQQPSAALDVGT